jgi:hypothetical protein
VNQVFESSLVNANGPGYAEIAFGGQAITASMILARTAFKHQAAARTKRSVQQLATIQAIRAKNVTHRR